MDSDIGDLTFLPLGGTGEIGMNLNLYRCDGKWLAVDCGIGFGGAAPLISSTKSLTGHSLGAAGAQEAIYCLLMMNNGFICESAHITELDPVFADMPIVRKRIDNARLGTVLSNSFGFGGTNATLVFKRLDG